MRTSNSAIQCFKSCRRMYELRYIHKLEPVSPPSKAIERGLSYHEALEKLLCGQDAEVENPKIRAMVGAFQIWIMPRLIRMGADVESVERWFKYETPSGHFVLGRFDALGADNSIIEHKTTSGLIDGAYWQRLDFDDQIPTYMIARNSNKIFYTVCSTPTIRQKKGETDDDFCNRCLNWYDDGSPQKIDVLAIRRDQEQLERFAEEQDAIINEMANCKLFYRNPNHCMKWGRMCDYAPICMNYDPNEEYIQFRRKEILHDEKIAEIED